MDKPTFIQALNALGTATSVNGKTYTNIRVQNGKVWFVRGSTGNTESIYLDELYELYKNEPHPTTTVARNYISGRVYSPAVAILRTLAARGGAKVAAKSGNTVTSPTKSSPGARENSDEARFFKVLARVLGAKYVVSKNLGSPVSGQHVFLHPNYRAYQFEDKIEKAYEQVLEALMSSGEFSSQGLAHHVDGLVWNQPKFGSRIVEFDEEQHFTPARGDALKVLKQAVKMPYAAAFIRYCEDPDYLQHHVLRKHRIRGPLWEGVSNFRDFVQWLQDSGASKSGYIKAKTGFPYLGGRMAQRAYYDCLRDTAHLSPKNKHLKPPIRFAKKAFEDTFNKPFGQVGDSELMEYIKQELSSSFK